MQLSWCPEGGKCRLLPYRPGTQVSSSAKKGVLDYRAHVASATRIDKSTCFLLNGPFIDRACPKPDGSICYSAAEADSPGVLLLMRGGLRKLRYLCPGIINVYRAVASTYMCMHVSLSTGTGLPSGR